MRVSRFSPLSIQSEGSLLFQFPLMNSRMIRFNQRFSSSKIGMFGKKK